MQPISAFSTEFFRAFLQGLTLNISAAFATLALSLPLGLLLARAMGSQWRVIARVSGGFNFLLHATPVFIAMFFMSAVISESSDALGPLRDMRPVVLLVLANMPYLVAYLADQFASMLRGLAASDRRAALLTIPNCGRGLQMVISATCFGAAVGVPEAMSVVIFVADQQPSEVEQLTVFAVAGVLFVIAQRICVLPFRVAHRFLDGQATPETLVTK